MTFPSKMTLRKSSSLIGIDGSHTTCVSNYCTQGGVRPPLAWCLVINELIAILKNNKFQTECFDEDDRATLIRDKFLRTACELLQTSLNTISEWCDKNELRINPDKIQLIGFTEQRKTEKISGCNN